MDFVVRPVVVSECYVFCHEQLKQLLMFERARFRAGSNGAKNRGVRNTQQENTEKHINVVNGMIAVISLS